MFCRWNNRAHVQRNSGRYDKRCTPRRGCYRSAAWEEEPDVTSFWLPKRGWGALNRKQSFWNCLKSGLGAPGKNSEWLAGPSAINVSFPALESSTAAAAVRARVGALGGVTSSDSGSGRPERALPGVTVPSRSLHCSLHTHTHHLSRKLGPGVDNSRTLPVGFSDKFILSHNEGNVKQKEVFLNYLANKPKQSWAPQMCSFTILLKFILFPERYCPAILTAGEMTNRTHGAKHLENARGSWAAVRGVRSG